MKKIFLLLSFFLLFESCEQIITEGDFSSSIKYPAKVGYEWEYNTTWKLELYDTLGHVDSTSFENLGNTVVKVTKEFDTVGTLSNLIRFEVFDVSTSQNVNKMWYVNDDSGLTAIAYYNPGASQPVLPKNGRSTIQQIKLLLRIFGILPAGYNFSNLPVLLTDSIQYYYPPRKVLKYPLKIGARWTELINPFYRERFIRKMQIVNTDNKNYNCFKVESKWEFSNTEFNDYVNFNSGLIMRELIADSIMITSPENPDSGRYGNITSISKLVRERK
jgi:hypothetical protein